MRRVMVGVDGSAMSIAALEWAAALARDAGARIHVVHAYHPAHSEKRPRVVARTEREMLDRLSGWCGSVLDDVDHELTAIDGDARDSLVRLAEEHGADLLVVASTGSSGAAPGPLHFGSVVEHLVRFTTVPIGVYPTADAESDDAPRVQHHSPPRRVLLAIDGSEHAASAARWARELVSVLGQDTITSVVRVSQDGDHPTADELRAAAGFEVEPVFVADHHPADGILDAADLVDADLIVMGTRGGGGFRGLHLGSVAIKVSRRSARPVVLVPPVH